MGKQIISSMLKLKEKENLERVSVEKLAEFIYDEDAGFAEQEKPNGEKTFIGFFIGQELRIRYVKADRNEFLYDAIILDGMEPWFYDVDLRKMIAGFYADRNLYADINECVGGGITLYFYEF